MSCQLGSHSKKSITSNVLCYLVSHQRRGSGAVSHVSVTPGGQCQGQCVTQPQGSVFASQHITDKTAVAADLVGVSL